MVSFEAAKSFFVVADAFGDCFDACAEVFDVGDQAGERARFVGSGAVFVDEGEELRVAVEGRAGDAGGDGNGGECDAAACRGEAGQRT